VDTQFGPVILFGAGGILVEILQDRALALPPINRTLARRLIERTQIYRALQGVRGQRPIDFESLETLLVRFSDLLCDCPDIQEIDMNPVLATPQQVVALDARVLLCPPDLPAEKRPRPVIQPYPSQYTTPLELSDGFTVVIRAIRPEDEPLLIELHAGHSERTIRMRFFGLVKTLSRDSLIRLCHLDYDRAMALVAEHKDKSGRPHLCGVSRYFLDPETAAAEFAVVVSDAWQGRGLGRHLMERLIAAARQRGVKRLVGAVLRENTAMLKFVEELGFSAQEANDPLAVQVTLVLD
jgi:acetyltransferase